LTPPNIEDTLKTAIQMLDDDRTAQSILMYLQEHPDSGDTVEGVAQWWVLQQPHQRIC